MISIIVPIYNMESRLDTCIKSLLRQSVRNIEILLVDDGSTDSSLAICRNYENTDGRIHVLTQKNGGVASARNCGLRYAAGEWICFSDPDDALPQDGLSSLLHATSPTTDIVASDYFVCVDGVRNPRRFFHNEMLVHTSEEKMPFILQLFDSFYDQDRLEGSTGIGVPWAKLYRHSFLKKNHLYFDLSLRRYQDNVFNLYAFAEASEIKYYHDYVYEYSYSHTMSTFQDYDPGYEEKAQTLIQARSKALQSTGLSENPAIRKAAVNSNLVLYATALKRSVFHQDNTLPFRDKCESAERLQMTEAFAPIFTENAHAMIKGTKNRLFYQLIRHRCWRFVAAYLTR